MGFGVVSLSLGNPRLPLAHRLGADAQGFGQLPLGHVLLDTIYSDPLSQVKTHSDTSCKKWRVKNGRKKAASRQSVSLPRAANRHEKEIPMPIPSAAQRWYGDGRT